MIKRLTVVAVCLAVALGAYLVFSGWQHRSPPTRATAPPPPEVGIITLKSSEVPLPAEYSGRVIGFRDVEVRALVGGILVKRGFEEGTRVTQDQPLFQIEPAPYKVALSRAEAQLAQAKATLRQAQDNSERTEELFARGVSTEKQRDEARTARDQGRASVQVAEAEVASAKLNLEYTEVNAPASGVTSLQSQSIGTLIQAQQTLLTTITPLDPAYVTFSFTDEESQAFRELNARRATPITAEEIIIDLQHGNRSMYPLPGKIDAAAQRVDPRTGTIQARAVFPNPDGSLLPGQFVRVRIRGVTLPNAIVIPKQAVNQGPQGPAVYVVTQNNVAEVRPIRLGPEVEDGVVVREGLKNDDRVIFDGIIRVRPGAPVRPVESAVSAGPRTPVNTPPAEPRR